MKLRAGIAVMLAAVAIAPPLSAAPLSAAPLSAAPLSAAPLSAAPLSAVSTGSNECGQSPVLGWSTNTLAQTRKTERTLGMRPGALGTFADFTSPFPRAWADAARERNVPLVISWEPWDWSKGAGDQPRFALRRIADGHFDGYARAWARQAAKYGSRVIVRFAPEMNGDWQAWYVNDSPRDFIRAWRHLHRLFGQEGAGRVQWAFTPISTWVGGPAYRQWWPGRAFVDWLGVDGYQWVGVLPGRVYASVRKVFSRSVDELRSLDASLPLMIPETAAAAPYKAKWLKDLAVELPSLGASLVLWFEHDKEADWRLAAQSWEPSIASELGSQGWCTHPMSPAAQGGN